MCKPIKFSLWRMSEDIWNVQFVNLEAIFTSLNKEHVNLEVQAPPRDQSSQRENLYFHSVHNQIKGLNHFEWLEKMHRKEEIRRRRKKGLLFQGKNQFSIK